MVLVENEVSIQIKLNNLIIRKEEKDIWIPVDDLMEPFRPFVDYFAYRILQDEKYFKGEHRRQLVNLLNHYRVYHNKKMYLCNALEEYGRLLAITEKQYQDMKVIIGSKKENEKMLGVERMIII